MVQSFCLPLSSALLLVEGSDLRDCVVRWFPGSCATRPVNYIYRVEFVENLRLSCASWSSYRRVVCLLLCGWMKCVCWCGVCIAETQSQRHHCHIEGKQVVLMKGMTFASSVPSHVSVSPHQFERKCRLCLVGAQQRKHSIPFTRNVSV
jgi:hypothetical protein